MAGDTLVSAKERIVVEGVSLEVLRRGTGKPALLLHGMRPCDPNADFIERLSRKLEVIAPSHPGFGGSPRPDGFETVYDLTRLYLGLIEQLGGEKVTLIGLSFGGWIAAEIASVCAHHIERLILVDALGIKVSDRETPDILDVFNTHPDEVRRRAFADPDRWAPDFDALSDEELTTHARNWDSLCLYGWSPYMYNPLLKRWLARIKVPTLVLWGANDGIVKPSYGKAYADLIPGARFATIDGAGHHPEIEQPDAFAERALAFIDGR